jgi:predicted transposase/invertase (TIGR01784 family)
MKGVSYMKTLKELTLLSKFLFDQTMDVPEAHEAALRIILGDQTLRLLTVPQTEKEIRTAPWLRSVRLDVYALDESRTVYNTEMQQEEKGDLLRRSRYYQSLIDSSLLEPGSVAFRQLNDTCIIMITPFDLFGKGKYCYTFCPCCEEDKDIKLNDGTVRIFLNSKGTNDSEVSKELVDFLHYIEQTDDESAQRSESENIRKIHACVKQIKASEEIGVKYMQTWEIRVMDREEGREEGKIVNLITLARKKYAKNISVEACAEMLETEASVIEKIYAAIQKHPELDDVQIYEELKEKL